VGRAVPLQRQPNGLATRLWRSETNVPWRRTSSGRPPRRRSSKSLSSSSPDTWVLWLQGQELNCRVIAPGQSDDDLGEFDGIHAVAQDGPSPCRQSPSPSSGGSWRTGSPQPGQIRSTRSSRYMEITPSGVQVGEARSLASPLSGSDVPQRLRPQGREQKVLGAADPEGKKLCGPCRRRGGTSRSARGGDGRSEFDSARTRLLR
jgi:hypothetical protein